MLQNSPIALAQVKAGEAFENVLNEVKQVVYSSYVNRNSKEVYNKLIIRINIDIILHNQCYFYKFQKVVKLQICIGEYATRLINRILVSYT